MGRMGAFCGSHGDRYVCIGGFSTQTSSLLSGATTFWAGVNYVEVEQTLPEGLSTGTSIQQNQVGSLSAAELVDLVEETRLNAALADSKCSIQTSGICG